MIYFSHRAKMIFSFPDNAIVAEIGVLRGDFAKLIQEIRPPKEFYLIDLWERQEGEYKKDPTNEKPLSQYYIDVCNDFKDVSSVKIIRNWSHLAADMFPDEYFDWIFLDADHSYASVKRDLIAWFPKVKNGGIFAGHDYASWQWIGVKPALDEFMEEKGLELSCLATEILTFPSWAFVK